MYDQANDLRDLVRTATVGGESAWQRPRLIAVTSGKGGVGTTTIALNLAIALSLQRQRVVLVDADPNGGNVHLYCKADGQWGRFDVLLGNTSVRRALQVGPADIRLLSGGWPPGKVPDEQNLMHFNAMVHERLVLPILDLGHSVDTVIVDAGSGPNPWIRHFWRAADSVLLVTTDQPASIMDAYASIKILHNAADRATVHPVINRVARKGVAEEIRLRLARAAYRFLAVRIGEAYHIPDDPMVTESTQLQEPLLLGQNVSPAATAIESIVKRLDQRAYVEVCVKQHV